MINPTDPSYPVRNRLNSICERALLPPMPEEQPVTPDEQVGQDDFHNVIRRLRRDVEGVREVTETTARTMPIYPPQAEAIQHKIGGHPRHQPECQRLAFAEKANQRNRDLDRCNRQHQLPKLDPDDRVNHGEKLGIAESAPYLGNSGYCQNRPDTENKPLGK